MLALSIARMVDALGNSILFIVIPIYVAKLPDSLFHVPVPLQVGILVSLYGITTSLLQPLTGAWSDHLGKRKLFIQLGLFTAAVATFSFVFAVRFFDLIFLRISQGIGMAMTIPTSMAIMTGITQQQTRGGSMGIYTTMRLIGFSIGPPLGGFLKVHFGFNATFYAGAGFLLLAMLLIHFWVQDVAPKNSTKRPFRIIEKGLFHPGILSAAAATFIMAGSFSMVITLENEFNNRLATTAFGFGIAFSALMIGRLLFQAPLGRLSDRIGRKPIILAGLILMAPATILLGESTSLLMLGLLRVFQGLAAACIAAPAFAVVADLSKAGGEGRQMSIITVGFTFGLALGPLIAGVLAIAFFELPFLTGGALALIGVWIVATYMPETLENAEHTIFHRRKK